MCQVLHEQLSYKTTETKQDVLCAAESGGGVVKIQET